MHFVDFIKNSFVYLRKSVILLHKNKNIYFMKKELLQLLLDECIKRDFTEISIQKGPLKVGMCRIAYLMMVEKIISIPEKNLLTRYLKENKPKDADYYYWYPLNNEGIYKRIEFLTQKIKEHATE